MCKSGNKYASVGYSEALREAMLILKNSEYALDIPEINSEDGLMKYRESIKMYTKELIGDIVAYYENIIEEALNSGKYENIDVDILSSLLTLGKNVIYDRIKQLEEYDSKSQKKVEEIVAINDKDIYNKQQKAKFEEARKMDSQLIEKESTRNDFKSSIAVTQEQLTPMSKQNENEESPKIEDKKLEKDDEIQNK